MSDVERFTKDLERFAKVAEKARAEMISACEHYANALATHAVAAERLERAKDKAERDNAYLREIVGSRTDGIL